MYTPNVGDRVIAFDAQAWSNSPVREITEKNAHNFWKYATVVSQYMTKKDSNRLRLAVVFDDEKALAKKEHRQESISYGHPAEWVMVSERAPAFNNFEIPGHGRLIAHQAEVNARSMAN